MSVFKYKQTGRVGLFDKEETTGKLSKLGNLLATAYLMTVPSGCFKTV